MMLLSIIGIIWVQIVWISNAVSIKNESFNYAVSHSLSNAANAIESSRNMNFFNNLMISDHLSFNNSTAGYGSFLNIGTISSMPGKSN